MSFCVTDMFLSSVNVKANTKNLMFAIGYRSCTTNSFHALGINSEGEKRIFGGRLKIFKLKLKLFDRKQAVMTEKKISALAILHGYNLHLYNDKKLKFTDSETRISINFLY